MTLQIFPNTPSLRRYESSFETWSRWCAWSRVFRTTVIRSDGETSAPHLALPLQDYPQPTHPRIPVSPKPIATIFWDSNSNDMDAQVHSSPLNTPSILSIAEHCRSQLRACTLSNKLVKSQWAYDRLSDFDLWDTSVGASAEGNGSLDFRLAEDQTSKKVVIVSLNTLKAWVSLCQMLADDITAQAMGPNGGRPATNASSETMDESNATTPDGITLEEAKSGVEELQTLLVTLGIAVRHAGATSHLDNNAQSAVKHETSLTSPNVLVPSERPEKASSVLNYSLHESTTVRGLQEQTMRVQENPIAPDTRTNPVEADNRPRYSTVYSGSSSRVGLVSDFKVPVPQFAHIGSNFTKVLHLSNQRTPRERDNAARTGRKWAMGTNRFARS